MDWDGVAGAELSELFVFGIEGDFSQAHDVEFARDRCCWLTSSGMMPYFDGPKNALCVAMANSTQ